MFLKLINVYSALVHLSINNSNYHYHNGGGLFTAFPKKNGSTSADKIDYSISNWFLENQRNEICSHLTEKASKGRFLKPENGLQNHSNEGKGKEKKKERRRRSGKDEKKKKQWNTASQVMHSDDIMACYFFRFTPLIPFISLLPVYLSEEFEKNFN